LKQRQCEIKDFCKEDLSKNAGAVYLLTDMNEIDSVDSFYIKNGFQPEGVIKQTMGRIMNRYIKFPDEKTL
jgi:hypothetical protein